MATILPWLVDPSKTVLIRWSNSCAIIAPSARDLRGTQSEQAMDGRGLIGHKTVLKHVRTFFRREFAFCVAS